jgi:hypothetical protein
MSTLQFDGIANDYIEIADGADFSVATTRHFHGVGLDAA